MFNITQFSARSNYETSASNVKASKTESTEADFGRLNAINNAFTTSWKGNFVSGGNNVGMKKNHWIEIQLKNEMMTAGVKILAMVNNKATDILQKTYIRAGLNPTSMSNRADISGLQSHMELSVYYEGPAVKGSEVHLLYDEPVKTKYIFLESKLDSDGRWGFAELEVLVAEEGLVYCVNVDPLTGVAVGDALSVNL